MGSIYKITNTVNGKTYIGQTIHDAVKKRIYLHLNGHPRGSQLIKRAVEKYGKDAFTYDILHDGIIPEFLNDLESEAIEKFNTVAPHGYNLTTGAGDRYTHSEETCRKISETLTGKRKSPEHCAKLSEVRKGKPGKPHSPETLRKMSESMRNSPKAKAQRERLHQQPVSAETRKKRSIALSGENNPMYGKPGTMKGRKHSPEARRRMSESTKGENNSHYGTKRSPETRKRISDGNKGKNQRPEYSIAHEFYLSLPPEMDHSEKRQLLRDYVPAVPYSTIWDWARQWESKP